MAGEKQGTSQGRICSLVYQGEYPLSTVLLLSRQFGSETTIKRESPWHPRRVSLRGRRCKLRDIRWVEGLRETLSPFQGFRFQGSTSLGRVCTRRAAGTRETRLHLVLHAPNPVPDSKRLRSVRPERSRKHRLWHAVHETRGSRLGRRRREGPFGRFETPRE